MHETVGDRLDAIRAELLAIERAAIEDGVFQSEATRASRQQRFRALQIQRGRLSKHPRDLRLLVSPAEALHSPLLSPEERFIIRWQFRRLFNFGDFESARLTMLGFADDENLEILARAYPLEVRALRAWRHDSSFVEQVRGTPISFTI